MISTMTLTKIFILICQISIFVPLICGIKFYSKLNKPFKWFVWFFLLCVFVEFGASLLKYLLGNNMLLLHIFTPIEFCIYTFVFSCFFKVNKVWHITLNIIFLVIAGVDALLINSFTKFNSLSHTFESLILISIALYFYYFNIKNNEYQLVFRQPMFWFTNAVLIYFCVNYFMFIMMNKFAINNKELGLLANYIHAFTNLLVNLLFAKAFTCFKWKA